MRVLHILDHSIPLHSGYAFRTGAILRHQRKAGLETFHLTSPKQGSDAETVEEVDGLLFYRTKSGPGYPPVLSEWRQMRQLEKRLEKLAAEIRPDVLHAHSPILTAIPALRVGRRLSIPVVYEIRAFWEDAAVDHGTTVEGSLRYRATRLMETRVLRRVAHAFTICEGLRADIVGRGIDPDKVTVIPNAVDSTNFSIIEPRHDEPGEDTRDHRIMLGFIGSFYAYEGLDFLLDSMQAIRERWPHARLLLVGGGPEFDRLKQQSEDLNLGGSVTFTGRVPHAEVQDFYQQIDILIYPRHSLRLTELVTPLKPLEAMAQGRLVIASDVGGHRELIRHKENGILFAADDSESLVKELDALLDREHDWARLRRNARRFVEAERNWQKSVAGYLPAYESVVSGVPSR